MTDLAARSFTIQSNLEIPVDGFQAETGSSAAFLEASENDTITLRAGYREAGGTAHMIGQITDGRIDEYVLQITPTSITTSVRGRDPLAKLLERRVARRYLRLPLSEVIETAAGAIPFITPEEGGSGRFRASQIAHDLAAQVGLGLSWQTRDYEIRDDFDAMGRPIDLIRQLAAPWSLAPATKVDLYMNGTTLVVKSRTLAPAPQYTFSVGDARIGTLTITRRRGLRFGQVVLSGMLVQGLATGDGASGDPTLTIEETPNRKEVETTTQSETTGPGGLVTGRIVSTLRYRMPDGVLLRSIKQVYTEGSQGLVLAQRETMENTWEEIEYDNGRPLKTASQLSQITTIEGIHPSDKTLTFQVLERQEVAYAYDTPGFLTQQTTLKRQLDLKRFAAGVQTTVPGQVVEGGFGALVKRELVVRDYVDSGPLLFDLSTSTFRRNEKLGVWTLLNQEVVPQGGHRPGGPGRSRVWFIPAGKQIGSEESGTLTPITLKDTISTDDEAQLLTYSNPNLTLEDLRFIMAQLRAASGRWEYELSFSGVTMPWIKRGVTIAFTDLRDEDGEPLALHADLPAGRTRAALVLDNVLSFREGDAQPSMTSQVRAIYYAMD